LNNDIKLAKQLYVLLVTFAASIRSSHRDKIKNTGSFSRGGSKNLWTGGSDFRRGVWGFS